MAKSAFQTEALRTTLASAVKAAWWSANGATARALTRPTAGQQARTFTPATEAPDPVRLRRAWMEAFLKDAADVRAGLYPLTERAGSPTAAARRAFDFITDARAVDARRRRGNGTEVREEPKSDAFPAYYRQNFHYQSGGWLTKDSARRYETQVEALFAGTAGPMRRRALSLLARAWRSADHRDRTILDLACGSGAMLVDLKGAFPRAQVFGLDLSCAYLAEATRRSGAPGVVGFAEQLPLADASLDAITCIFLFHELPPRLRPVIAGEIARVLKPGGVLALADSVQEADEPKLARFLEAFPAFFHEPFYASYQTTDITGLFTDAGLTPLATDKAFLTKAWSFAKPA